MTSKPASLISRNPIFRNFLAASSISLLGNNIFDIAIPLYIVQKNPDPVLLSLGTLALTLPFFLMAPITGFTADNFDKRKVMLASDLGQIASLILLLILDHYSQSQFWPVLGIIFIAKTLMITFETVATFQLVPALVVERDLNEANSWFLSSQRLIQILGPLIAGILMSVSGIRLCILINIFSFIATLFFVLRAKNLNKLIDGDSIVSHRRKMTVGGVIDSFIESVQYVWSSKLFHPFILMMFVWNISSLVPNTPSFVYYFNVEKQFNSTEYGMVTALFGFFGIVGYLISGRLYEKFFFYKPFVLGAAYFATLGCLSLFFFDKPYFLAIVFGLSRIGSSIVTMGTFYLRQTTIPRNKMGGVNSALRMFFMSSAPLAALLQGFLIKYFNVKTSFFVGGVFLLLAFFYSKKVAVAYLAWGHRKSFSKKAA
ncbi:MAG: MFS transporter [Deltaproteobacteria bacterium]|nr:MFS transporter [Deltaproteobacteria bacterium]